MKKVLLIALGIILFVGLLGRAILYSNGVAVSSWWRSPWKNASVEGKMFSLHLIGWAYDVVPVNGAVMETLFHYPWKVVTEKDHFHIQLL
jgi:hypothetical protein